jgi:hypothetical protein
MVYEPSDDKRRRPLRSHTTIVIAMLDNLKPNANEDFMGMAHRYEFVSRKVIHEQQVITSTLLGPPNCVDSDNKRPAMVCHGASVRNL